MNQDNTKNILNQKNNITQHKNEINRLYKVEVGLEDKVIFSVASICMGLTAVVTFIAFNLLPLLCVGIPAVIVGFCLMTKYSLSPCTKPYPSR